uniref:NagB/RpiA/CoA transferase-like superfamily protein n=2 Tax=Zea mays TaxID=4577 RepID=A0A804M0P9_MAIZE
SPLSRSLSSQSHTRLERRPPAPNFQANPWRRPRPWISAGRHAPRRAAWSPRSARSGSSPRTPPRRPSSCPPLPRSRRHRHSRGRPGGRRRRLKTSPRPTLPRHDPSPAPRRQPRPGPTLPRGPRHFRAGAFVPAPQRCVRDRRQRLLATRAFCCGASLLQKKTSVGLAEIQNDGAPASIPQKQKTSKAERRAIQEAQRAAKAATKEADKSGKSAGAAISKQAKPVKTVQKKDVPQAASTVVSEKKATERPPERERKLDAPHPRMQFDDVHKVEKAKKRAVVNQSEARNRVELFRHLPQ